MSTKRGTVTERDVKNFISFAKRNPILAAILVIAVIGLFVWQGISDKNNGVVPSTDGLTVSYIDIGQGDAELIACGGEYMLIDGGDVSMGDELCEYLTGRGVNKIDYMVCTHGHADHCGGLDEVLKAFPVETVFTSPYPGDNKVYQIFADAVEKAGLSAEVPEMGVHYRLGDAEFEFIGPLEDYGDRNADSLVMRLEYGKTSFLFTGDMTSKAEKDLIESGADVSCDVLKVGHHGSSGSSCYQFLYEASPRIAVISCETGNSYGHPHEETLSRLADADAEILRTDTMGTVTVFSDGVSVVRQAA